MPWSFLSQAPLQAASHLLILLVMKPSFLTVLIATVVTLSHVTAETRSLRGSRELTGTKESKKCIGNKCMDKVEPTDFEPKDVNDQDKPTVITVIHRFDNFTAPNTTLESQYLIKEQPIQEEETPSDATFIVGTWPPDPVIKQVNSTLPTFPSVERIEEKLDKKKKDAPTNDVHSTPGPLQGESETSDNAETSTAVDTTSPPDPHVEQSKEETEPDNATVGPVVDPHVEQQKPESKKPDIKETTDDKDPPQDKSVPPPRDESGNCGKAEKKDTGKDKEDPMSMDPQDSSNPEKRLGTSRKRWELLCCQLQYWLTCSYPNKHHRITALQRVLFRLPPLYCHPYWKLYSLRPRLPRFDSTRKLWEFRRLVRPQRQVL